MQVYGCGSGVQVYRVGLLGFRFQVLGFGLQCLTYRVDGCSSSGGGLGLGRALQEVCGMEGRVFGGLRFCRGAKRLCQF